jgi:hypothetical protein
VELWRARPGDVIVLPSLPGQVTVKGLGRGRHHLRAQVEWKRADGTSGTLDLGKFAGVQLLASGDGVNAPWLDESRECRWHGRVADDHFPCRAPGESAELFTARCLGTIRDV